MSWRATLDTQSASGETRRPPRGQTFGTFRTLGSRDDPLPSRAEPSGHNTDTSGARSAITAAHPPPPQTAAFAATPCPLTPPRALPYHRQDS